MDKMWAAINEEVIRIEAQGAATDANIDAINDEVEAFLLRVSDGVDEAGVPFSTCFEVWRPNTELRINGASPPALTDGGSSYTNRSFR